MIAPDARKSMTPKKVCRRLMLGSILGSIHISALAQTVVSTETHTPLNTQTAGDVTIEEDGSVELSSGVPVTINSAADLEIEDGGLIEAGEDSGTSGVLVTTTGPFSIVNEGLIQVEEDFLPDDEDGNNVPDGPIAESSDRAGIRVTSAAQGTIDNQDTISVEGLNSYGIVVEDSFTGDIINDGYIYTIGDYSTGISLQSVDGDILLEGQVLATGAGAQGLVIGGDVTGTLSIQGTIGQASSFTNDDDTTMSLSRADLRVRAPAVEIGGSIDGGILIAAPPYDLDDDEGDEDNDDVTDSSEATGQIVSYGVSPALYIGGANPIEIGGVTGRDGTFSLAVDGSISSTATYSSISTVAVEIGGEQQVLLGEGIGVTGSIKATTYDAEAIAILLNESAVVPSLYNSGSITASITSSGDGSTIAILDRSGTLIDIQNSGFINAGGSREDVKVALDLSNAASSVTVNQYLNEIDADAKAEEADEDDYDPDNPTIYTAIYGDLLLSNHDDSVTVSSGLISGHTYFNDGDDFLSLSDDAVYSGNIHGGLGELSVELRDSSKYYGTIDAALQLATLNLFDSARFTGTFENAANLTVNVNGGKLFAEDGEVASFGNLNVTSGGSIGIVIDGEDGTSSSFNVGTANFDQGSKVLAEITSISNAEGSYQVLTAGQITGTPTFDPETNDIPLLFDADLIVGSNSITLNIERKTADELGFNQAQAAAYDPILAMLADQSSLESSILEADSIPELQSQFQQLLPDYSGGVFEFASLASRIASSRISEESQDFDGSDLGGWIAPYYFQSGLSGADSEDVKIDGKGLAGGFEVFAALGTFGVDLSYTSGKLTNGDRQDLKLSLLEGGVYYRRSFGPIYTFARVAGGEIKVTSSREFEGVIDGDSFTYSADGSWKGTKFSGLAGASSKLKVGDRLAFIPAVSLDYQWLKEKGYDETGDPIVLSVDSRTSSRLAALASLTSSIRLGGIPREGVPITLDVQMGRSFNLIEKLGDTTAFFDDGDPFTITAPSRSGLWQAEAKVHGGGYAGNWAVIVGGEKSKDQWSASIRAAVSVAF